MKQQKDSLNKITFNLIFLFLTCFLILERQESRADLVLKAQGKKPSSQLSIKQSGVPQYKMFDRSGKLKEVPRLDIGIENRVQADGVSTLTFPALPLGKFKDFQKQISPDSPAIDKKIKQYKQEQVGKLKELVQVVNQGQGQEKKQTTVPALPTLNEIKEPTLKGLPESKIIKVISMSPNELKLLQALIFLEIQKNYNLAIGLFSELLVEDSQHKIESSYNLALTALGLGLRSEYEYQMLKVLKEGSKEWQKKASLQLAVNSLIGETHLVPILDPKIESLGLEAQFFDKEASSANADSEVKASSEANSNSDANLNSNANSNSNSNANANPEEKKTAEKVKADIFQINRAKYYMEKTNLSLALQALDLINENSKNFGQALFLRSTLLYRSGQLKESLEMQKTTYDWLEKNDSSSELRSVSALTLARMYFQSSQYKEAYQAYLKIDKKHNDWPQAMIESSWSQILMEDYEGAAGNMYSLHTDFFKNTFAPDSYVVRTVGYLNLCQFGDAAKSVIDLKKKYMPMLKKMDEFKKKYKTEMDYYNTVKSFLKDPSQKMVNGLPKYLIYELARHPSFFDEQGHINYLEDQTLKYNQITLDLLKRERDLIKLQNESQDQYNMLKKKLEQGTKLDKASIQQELLHQERRLTSYKIQNYIAKKARNSIKNLKDKTAPRFETEKEQFKARAALALKKRFEKMNATLASTLDQSDVLSYELYSGAGEHLRYQMAGGEITEKQREELKPDDKKQINWEFRGEIWEDELGHYRSSLKNVCPKEGA